VANELGKVLVFLETSSRSSPVGVLFSVEKKDGKDVLGLKASLPSSGGFWASLGGAFPSFAEVVRSEGFVKVQISPAERRELNFLLAVRLAASEEVRVTMDCSVLEKEPLGKDRLLNLQSKGHLARLPSARGTPGSARKPLPHLKLQTWRNFLVSLVGWVARLGLGWVLDPISDSKVSVWAWFWQSSKQKSGLRIRVKGTLWILKGVLSSPWVVGLLRVFNSRRRQRQSTWVAGCLLRPVLGCLLRPVLGCLLRLVLGCLF
jgi:hypothetical protein